MLVNYNLQLLVLARNTYPISVVLKELKSAYNVHVHGTFGTSYNIPGLNINQNCYVLVGTCTYMVQPVLAKVCQVLVAA